MTFRDMITIRAAGIQGYRELMQSLGVAPSPLLLRNGLDPASLDDPETLLPLHSIIRLLEESAAATQYPDFGLHLAAKLDLGILGVIALVIQNAPTARQAITDISKYLSLHSPAFEIIVDEKSLKFDDCSALRFEIHLPVFIEQRQTVDGCIGYLFKFLSALFGDLFLVRAVSLPHSPLSLKSNYQKFFHAPVIFEEPYAAIHIHRSIFGQNLKSFNPAVRELALDHILRQLPPQTSPMSYRVRQALTRTVGLNHGTKSEIGQLLGMHPRTMQRRLHQEGVSFEAIREDVYKSATLRFLRETQIPLKQLAGALGFSEQSALTRSCKRWFDSSPSEIRFGAKDR